MPRVHAKTKNRGGKTGEYDCGRCADPIKPGDSYYEWSFRYGGTHRQHQKHGYPRQSQLTQSRMSEVYAAVESVQDIVAGDPGAWTKDDVVSALQEAITAAEEIRDEKRSAADEHFNGGGPLAEQADELEDVVQTLEGAHSTVEYVDEPDDIEPDEDDEDDVEVEGEPWYEEIRSAVSDISI